MTEGVETRENRPHRQAIRHQLSYCDSTPTILLSPTPLFLPYGTRKFSGLGTHTGKTMTHIWQRGMWYGIRYQTGSDYRREGHMDLIRCEHVSYSRQSHLRIAISRSIKRP
jgi:hypothetical protein